MSMKLQEALKLAQLICNPLSLSPLHRAIELSPGWIRASSEFGSIEIGVLDLEVSALVDGQNLCSVLLSLDTEDKLYLNTSASSLHWRSGAALGQLNFANVEQGMPRDLAQDDAILVWTPPPGFAEAMELAASACTAAAVSMGLYGIEMLVRPAEKAVVLRSSNSIALACSSVGGSFEPADAYARQYVLRPPVHKILATLAVAGSENLLMFGERTITVAGESFTAVLPVAAALEHDLGKIMHKFENAEKVVQIDKAGIKKFLMRARALADKRQSTSVHLRVNEGRLILEHKGVSSSSEEYFLAEGLEQTENFNTITLPLDMLLAPLEHTDYVIFDYQDRNTLLLAGDDYDFLYILGGSRKA